MDLKIENATTDKVEEERVYNVNTTFLGETFNHAVLDSGCSRTVSGKIWLDVYRQLLTPEENIKLDETLSSSGRVFKFGDGKVTNSIGTVKVPASLVGARVYIETDIVEQDIPMLLSRESMARASTTINFESEEVVMLGHKQTIIKTTTGHYCIPLSRRSIQDTDMLSGPVSTILFTNGSFLDGNVDCKKIARKLHEQFGHPSNSRLIKLIKDGGVNNDALCKSIEEVGNKCEICQKYKKKPLRPIVCFPRAKTFNENLAIDLKVFSDDYMLHIIDQFTRFSRTITIKNKRAETVVKGVLQTWIAIFGSPKTILADNGLEFNNEGFRDLCDALGICVYGTAAESPWSNGVNERHNGVLGTMIEKLMEKGHTLEDAMCWATSAKNALCNVEGYSPNQLVFGINPNYPSVLSSALPALEELSEREYLFKILNAQKEAREEFTKAEIDERLKRAIKRKVRKHITSLTYEMGEKVYYLRKDKWKGPGTVVGKEHKDVLVKHGGSYFRVHPCSLQKVNSEQIPGSGDKQLGEMVNKQTETSANSNSSQKNQCADVVSEENQSRNEGALRIQTQMLPRAEPDEDAQPQLEEIEREEIDIQTQENNDTGLTESAGGTGADTSKSVEEVWLDKDTKPVPKTLVQIQKEGDDVLETYRIVSRGGKKGGKNANWFNVYSPSDQNSKIFSINWDVIKRWKSIPEEILISVNKNDYETSEAKLAEIQKWSEFNVYNEVENIGQNFITVQWVVTQKYEEEKRIIKARLVARGFQEDSSGIRKDSPTTTRESTRLLICFSEAKDWKIHSLDIKSAFLQGSVLIRDVFIKPPKEASTDKLWKLNKCVYGLTDASRMWYLKLDKTLRELGLKKMPLDEAFYVCRKDNTIKGMVCIHVDDILWSGDQDFKNEVINGIKATFQVSKETSGEFVFLGLRIKQHNDCTTIDQDHYIESLEDPGIEVADRKKDEMLSSNECKVLKRFVGQLAWACNLSRPDIAFDTCVLSVGVEKSCVSDVLKGRKILRKLKQTQINIRIVSLTNIEECSIELYSDASFANLKGSASQAGFVIFLVDKYRRANIVKWQSRKISRVIKSTLAAEALALLEGAENAYYIKRLIEDILGTKTNIHVHCISDNRSLVDAINSTNTLTDYRLRIDMSCLRSMVNNGELASVSWIRTQDQLADCLTKQGASCHKLLNVLRTNTINF